MPLQPLDQITIRGFRSIAAINALTLGPINILIGANGSGKSNFLGALSFLRSIAEGRLRDTVTKASGAERLLHFGSRTTREMVFEASFNGGMHFFYQLSLGATNDDGLYPTREASGVQDSTLLPQWGSLGPREKGREAGISEPLFSGPPLSVRNRLLSLRASHFHDTTQLRTTAKLDDNSFLRADGSNLAPFLFLIQASHRPSYDLIRRAVQQVAPFFDDFDLKPLQRARDDIKLEWRHRGSDQYFDAASLSDGTLRFMALATLFLQPTEFRPSIILIDEPELGLHPYGIGLLASLIRSASIETQVIVSTQSSLLLDHFDPEDVLVTDRVDNSTQISRLDPERLKDWLKEYSLGQLWEKNELGGRPHS